MGIFSLVSLDADVTKNLQALRAAVQKTKFAAAFLSLNRIMNLPILI